MMKKSPLLAFGLIHAVLFLFVFVVVTQFFYWAPGELERQVALQIIGGHVPYLDFTDEYPPLALLSFLLPALLFRTSLAYAIAFAAEMFIFDLSILALLRDLAARFKLSVTAVLGVYTLFIMAVGPLTVIRYDLFPAMLVLLSLWAFTREKIKNAWASLALGVMAKIYPVIIAPLYGLYQLYRRQFGRLVRSIIAFVLVTIGLSAPWLILNANGFLYVFRYHSERWLQSESTYASVLEVGQLLGLTQTRGELTFGSWNIRSALADSLAVWSVYIAVAALIIIYMIYLRRLSQTRANTTTAGFYDMLYFSALVILVFMLTNKVFSAQYLIWLCPMLPLIKGKWRVPVWSLFIIASGLTQALFPYAYIAFELNQPYAVILLAVRNALLIAVAVLLLIPLFKKNPGLSPED